jgi:hypothetical protein
LKEAKIEEDLNAKMEYKEKIDSRFKKVRYVAKPSDTVTVVGEIKDVNDQVMDWSQQQYSDASSTSTHSGGITLCRSE